YNTGIRTKPRLAGSPPGLRLGSTALMKQALAAAITCVTTAAPMQWRAEREVPGVIVCVAMP
ncbi:hypothetical protein AB0C42_29290, partial [Micromonospora taraxaci]|uniref:hypothetical protein n=1 Tax=Micromonospora taraxaci TaxID=1316803 RepID=UPI0033D55E3B